MEKKSWASGCAGHKPSPVACGEPTPGRPPPLSAALARSSPPSACLRRPAQSRAARALLPSGSGRSAAEAGCICPRRTSAAGAGPHPRAHLRRRGRAAPPPRLRCRGRAAPPRASASGAGPQPPAHLRRHAAAGRGGATRRGAAPARERREGRRAREERRDEGKNGEGKGKR